MALKVIREMVDSMGDSERVVINGGEILIEGGFPPGLSPDDSKIRAKRLYDVLKCETFGCMPLRKDLLKGLDLWYNDDESLDRNDESLNEIATTLLGDQMFGGKLHGPVLLARMEA